MFLLLSFWFLIFSIHGSFLEPLFFLRSSFLANMHCFFPNFGFHTHKMFNPTDVPMSPYYLHYSHALGISLVSQHLIGKNYVPWCRAIIFTLSSKNKVWFIDGSTPKHGDENLIFPNSWIRNNNIVISWILNLVSKEIATSLLYSNTTFKILEDSNLRFKQSNDPKFFQLQFEPIRNRQEQRTINQCFTKRKIIWEEFRKFRQTCTCGKCSCGGVKQLAILHQTKYLMYFLMGLNKSYAHAR